MGVPDIFIYSTDSAMKKFIDSNFACVPDSEGNAKCHNMDVSDSGTDMKLPSQPEPEKKTPLHQQDGKSSSAQSKCSGSCYNPQDCDINSDCICATDKGT